MSLRTFLTFFLLYSLSSLPAFGQIVADFDLEDPDDPLKNSANENAPALSINPFARFTEGGVYTVPNPDRPGTHQNINLEIPLSLVKDLPTVYLEWEFRCQEEAGWLIYSGGNLSSGIFHSATKGFNIRYYTRESPDAEPMEFRTEFKEPLIPPMPRGQLVKVGFYYNQDDGIARLYMDGKEIWKSTDHGFAPTPGAPLFWQTKNETFFVAFGVNGGGSTTPSLYRFRVFEEGCSDPISPEIVGEESVTEVCVGETATLVASAGEAEGTFQWYKGSSPEELVRIVGATASTYQTEVQNTSGDHNYYVTFTDGPCESEPVEVRVKVNDQPNPPTAEDHQPLCGSGIFTLKVDGGQEGCYRWYTTDPSNNPLATAIPEENGSTLTTEELTTTESFYVTIVGENGCESAPKEVKAEIKTIPPQPEVIPIDPLCENDLQEVEIQVVSQEAGYTYNWYADQDRTQLIKANTGPSLTTNITRDTSFYVTASNGTCESLEHALVEIEVVEAPEIDAGEDVTILKGESVQLLVSGELTTYQWEPSFGLDMDNIMNPKASPTYTVSYVVTGTNAAGCEVKDTVTVHVIEEFPVPNAFSPNQDNVNDLWEIPGSSSGNNQLESLDTEYPNCRIMVFNRWGNQVFYSEGYKEPWDGTFNGQKLDPGTYYYTLDLGNGQEPVKGTITIIP